MSRYSDEEGETHRIFLETERNNYYGVRRILREDCNAANLVDGYGDTPLLLAVKREQECIAGRLLKSDSRIDVRDTSGNTPLHCAVEQGNIHIVWMLLQIMLRNNQIELINQTNDAGGTPLRTARRVLGAEWPSNQALRAELEDIIQCLIAHGATDPLE